MTTAQASTTSTTTEEQRLAEVEQILTDLWFGWFDAIYRKDPDALWDVVATSSKFDSAVAAMDTLEFQTPPSESALDVRVIEVLLDREDCLVAQSSTEAPFIQGSPSSQSVQVLWPDPARGWRFATSWVHPNDLWLADCDEIVRETTP
jgi:hypothetical protein